MGRIEVSLSRLVLLLAAAAFPLLSAATEHRSILCPDGHATCFSGEPVTLRLMLHDPTSQSGTLAWAYSAQRHTLAAGEIQVIFDPSKPAQVEIPLKGPEVREGVIYDTQFRARLVGRHGEARAEFRRVFWIFPRNPFADRRQWLQRLNIAVYDPGGKTLTTLLDAKVPCTRIRSLETQSAGVIVIGEGVRLSGSLTETMTRLAAAGATVLCLSPADTSLPFPGTGDGSPAASRIALCQADIIHELDKRLDIEGWSAKGDAVSTRLRPEAFRGQVSLRPTEATQGWPWIDVGYPSGGRLIICGFGIIRCWDAGPTPRYLLLRILESTDRAEKSTLSLSSPE
jgi:hypothetical protein